MGGSLAPPMADPQERSFRSARLSLRFPLPFRCRYRRFRRDLATVALVFFAGFMARSILLA